MAPEPAPSQPDAPQANVEPAMAVPVAPPTLDEWRARIADTTDPEQLRAWGTSTNDGKVQKLLLDRFTALNG